MRQVIRYRPDIDGLRAIAVLAVIIYHFNPSWLYGGFLGVDVFFVISGYLITRIILRENQNECFSFWDFYARRIKRIFPALFVVILFSAVLAIIALPPETYENFFQSMKYASAQISNFFFSKDTDYFAESLQNQPLLHTWSLAVEEQFYLIWPFLLFGIFKIFHNSRRLILGFFFLFIAVVSFLLCVWLAYTYPNQGFYMFYARGWEFCFGAIFALDLIPNIKNKRMNNLVALAGLVLLIISFVLIKDGTDFLKGAVIVPCLGVALLIYTAQQQETWASKGLSFSFFLFIGVMSYSLYLWHWPVIVFYQNIFPTYEISYISASILLLLSICFAQLSYLFVEKPFRAGKWKNTTIFMVAASIMLIFVFGAKLMQNQGHAAWRYVENQPIAENPSIGINCESDVKYFDQLEKCTYGNTAEAPRILFLGDSHSLHYFHAVRLWAEESNISFTHIAQLGCPYIFDDFREGKSKCTPYFERIRNLLSEENDYDYIIWALRGDVKVVPSFWKEGFKKNAFDLFEQSFLNTVELSKQLNKNLIILDQIPVVTQASMNCFRTEGLLISKLLRKTCEEHVADILDVGANQKIEKISHMYNQLAKEEDMLYVFDPKDHIKEIKNAEYMLYLDNNHITYAGAEHMAPHLKKFLNAVIKF